MKITIRKRTVFIFLTLIGLLAYFNSFSVPFHYDDISFLRENPSIKSFQLFSSWITESYSRIIIERAFLLFTFYLNYVINGLDTFGYHIVNLFIHVSTAFLFYLLIARYMDKSVIVRSEIPRLSLRGSQGEPKQSQDRLGTGSAIPQDEIATPSARNDKMGEARNDKLDKTCNDRWRIALNDNSGVAILAASLFLLHPINTESVTYISSRSSVLSAFFILASMLCFFRANVKNNAPQPPKNITPPSPPLNLRGGREGLRGGEGELRGSCDGNEGEFIRRNFHAGYYTLSILFFLLGLSTKEAAIVTPTLILLFDFYFISDDGKDFKSRIKYHLPFWLIILVGSFYYLGYVIRPAMYNRPWSVHIFTEFKVFTEYLKLLILPLNLNIDHDIRSSMTLDLSVIISMAIISGLLISAILLKNKNKILSFSVLWFLLNLSPFLLIRIEDYMAERWVYTATLGFALFISELLIILVSRYKKAGVLAIGFLLISFGILTHIRNDVYISPVTLWSDAIKKSPDKIRPYINLCAAYVEREESDKAIAACRTAVEKGSRDADTYINLASAYFYKDALNNAKAVLLSMPKVKGLIASKEAIEAYHYTLGAIYKRKKEYRKAIEEYEKVLKIKPQSPAPLALIGECYIQLNKKDKANEYFRLSTNGIPQNGDDYLMLAKSFFRIGEIQKGFESLRNAVITEPLNTNIRYLVATTYLEIKNYDLAYKHFSIVTKLSPQYAPAYKGMGQSMLAKGNLKEASKHFNKALSLLPPNSPERKEVLEFLDKIQG